MWQWWLFINISMQLHTFKYYFTSLPAFIHPSPPSLPPCLHACTYACVYACGYGHSSVFTMVTMNTALSLLWRRHSSSCACCWTVDWTMQEWSPALLLYAGVNKLMVHCKICVLFCDGIAILFYAQMHIEHHTWSRFALVTRSIGNVWFSDHR